MVTQSGVRRFDVFLISLDPTKSTEIKKNRPCLVISLDEMNRHIRTVIIAPMTSTLNSYPTRVYTEFQGKQGQIVLDQTRTVYKQRLVKKLTNISDATQGKVLDTLQSMFSM